MKYSNKTNQELIDLLRERDEAIFDLEYEIDDLELKIETLESNITELEIDISAREEDLQTLEEQMEESKPYNHLQSNLRDEIKFEYIEENYSKIDLEDLEQIINAKTK